MSTGRWWKKSWLEGGNFPGAAVRMAGQPHMSTYVSRLHAAPRHGERDSRLHVAYAAQSSILSRPGGAGPGAHRGGRLRGLDMTWFPGYELGSDGIAMDRARLSGPWDFSQPHLVSDRLDHLSPWLLADICRSLDSRQHVGNTYRFAKSMNQDGKGSKNKKAQRYDQE
jgi:hypothetical protein